MSVERDLVISSKGKLSLFEKKLLSIINKSIILSNPKNILKNQIKKLSDKKFSIRDKTVDLSNGNLYVLGWGKASGAMAEGVEEILGAEMIKEGIVISSSIGYNLKKIKFFKGSHPFPSKKNIYATKEIVNLAKKCNKNDYVICLVSGGGSALLCLPSQGISLAEKIEITKTMILSGIAVEEINKVRKHLSDIKGGKLAKLIYPATIINLIISDDIRNTINAIASGPTVPDPSTFDDALQIIDKHGLTNKLPSNVLHYIKSNLGNKEKETLKENSIVAHKITNLIIYDNKALLETLKEVAIKKGFEKVAIYPEILNNNLNEAISKFCSFINDVKNKKSDSNFLVLAGGEVEVKVVNKGKGGRAQHFTALMIPELQNFKNSAFASIASDGRDFIEGIAGAVITNKTMDTIIEKKIDYNKYINETDTFNLHTKLGTILFTMKPTQTNVFDIYIFGQKSKGGQD